MNHKSRPFTQIFRVNVADTSKAKQTAQLYNKEVSKQFHEGPMSWDRSKNDMYITRSNYSDKKPQNLYIRQHAGYSDDEYGPSPGIYHQDLKNEQQTSEYTKGNIKASSIRSLSVSNNDEQKTVDAYRIMMGFASDNGNLIFGFCGFGQCDKIEGNGKMIDSEKLSKVHEFFELDKSVNIFTNTNTTSLSGYLDKKNPSLTVPTLIDSPFNWLKFNGTGMLDAGIDLKLNSKGLSDGNKENKSTSETKRPRVIQR